MMGTDVYLNWDNATEEDKKKQITGWDIGRGHVGYLRASIGMVKENQVLRAVFPEECWNGNAIEYNFKDNYERMTKIGAKYILSALCGKSIVHDTPITKGHQTQIVMAESVFGMLEVVAKGKNGKIEVMNAEGFRYAVMWLNSLFGFFDLGYNKQKEGKNPTVEISW